MSDKTLQFQVDRTLIVRSMREPVKNIESVVSPGFVAMLPSFGDWDRMTVEAVATELVDLGCVEFCCVGHDAEELHDTIDCIIEDKNAFDVVTTWIEDGVDACEYFVHAAGGKPRCLLGLVDDYPTLVATLLSTINSTSMNSGGSGDTTLNSEDAQEGGKKDHDE